MSEQTPNQSQLDIDQNKKDALFQVVSEINHPELVKIVKEYIDSDDQTDIQRMLINPGTRDLIVSELKKIVAFSEMSVANILGDLEESISGTGIDSNQENVDLLTEKMKVAGSRLVDPSNFPQPSDSNYWEAEANFTEERRSSNERWSAWNEHDSAHNEQIDTLLEETKEKEPGLLVFMNEVIELAGLEEEEVVTHSVRTKKKNSILGKLAKFRESPWGKKAIEKGGSISIADLFDLLGGRVVVNDLESLEKITLALEASVESNGFKILRKENKFISNHGKPDPYRAIQYTIAMEDDATFELQLKTTSSMIASDLIHNIAYKDVIGLPGSFGDVVTEYGWAANEAEMSAYLDAKGGLDTYEGVEYVVDENSRLLSAVEVLDYAAIYDGLLAKLSADKKLSADEVVLFKLLHEKQKEQIMDIYAKNPAMIMDLASQSHNAYFNEGALPLLGEASYHLGNELPIEAVAILEKNGLDNAYKNRYENLSQGGGTKLSIKELDLGELSPEDLSSFLEACGKKANSDRIVMIKGGLGEPSDRDFDEIKNLMRRANIISSEENPSREEAREKILNIKVMNLFHDTFENLLEYADNQEKQIENAESRKMWHEMLLDSQVNAVTSSVLVGELEMKSGVSFSRKVEDDSNYDYGDMTYRDMYIYMLFITAIRDDSPQSGMSYQEFLEGPFEWQRNFDRLIDSAIWKGMLEMQLGAMLEKIDIFEGNVVRQVRLLGLIDDLNIRAVKAGVNPELLTTSMKRVGKLYAQLALRNE